MAAPATAVYAFLLERENHWRLDGPRIQLLELAPGSGPRMQGRLVVRGPFAIRRTASIRLVGYRPPALLDGVAKIGRRTRVHVRWNLHATGAETTRVELTATISPIAVIDRLLLALGGQALMRTAFAHTLYMLSQQPIVVPRGRRLKVLPGGGISDDDVAGRVPEVHDAKVPTTPPTAAA